MRVGEAIRLDRTDYDAAAGTLTVRGTKFGKSRHLPLHPTAITGLNKYLRLRGELMPIPRAPALLLTARGCRLRYERTWETFHGLTVSAGLKPRSPACRPRIHDLRHSFAVATLLVSPSGADVQAMLPRLSAYLGHADPRHTYAYLSAAPELLALAVGRLQASQEEADTMTTLTSTVQAFFTDYLTRQRRASPYTIAAYRDSLRLLLAFTARQAGTQPARLEITDLDAPVIGAFLDHLEKERCNSVRTRNARLAAIHALFSFAALRHLDHAAVIQRVMAIPPKRSDRKLVTYLTEPEAAALLAAPDPATTTGRRDHALLTLAIQAGLRVSELTALTRADAFLGTGAHVTCTGKGRRQRITPLTPATAKGLGGWLGEHPGKPGDPLFPSRSGSPHEPLRSRAAPHKAHDRGSPHPAVPQRQKGLASRPEAHRRDAAAGSRSRYHRHRTLAGARIGRHDPDIHPRRPCHQGKSTRPNSPARRQNRTLPAPGHPRGVPRVPVIMPPAVRPAAMTDTAPDGGIGITTGSA